MLSQPRMLVFTDFRASSDLALKSAESIRKKVGGSVHVVHVSDIQVQWDWVASGAGTLLMSENAISHHLLSVNKLFKDQIFRSNIECTTEVIFNTIFEGIERAIDKKKPDLVIMGSQNLSQSMLVIGSTISKVVATSSVPVLVIKKALDFPLKRIAGLVNPEGPMSQIINAAEEFSFLFSAETEVISLWRNPTSFSLNFDGLEKIIPPSQLSEEKREIVLQHIRDEIAKSLDQHTKCKIRVEMTDEKKVAFHLIKILEEDQVEMAVMKRHQKGLIEKMFIGSETRRLLEVFNGNVLVLPP